LLFYLYYTNNQSIKISMSAQAQSHCNVICVFERGVYLRIVSLPAELRTSVDVKNFIENDLILAKVKNVQIVNKVTASGARYRSATVWISEWRISQSAQNLRRKMIENGDSGVIILNNGETLKRPFDFHFDNGMSMFHIKMVYEKEKSPEICESEEMKFMDIGNTWNSIYIPVIFDEYSKEDRLKSLFANDLKIGQVSRVDYITKCEGETNFVSAYVHFEKWFDTEFTRKVRATIEHNGVYKCHNYISTFGVVNFGNGRHLSLKMNHKPIPTVSNPELNVHQLVAMNVALEKRIAELELENAELRSVSSKCEIVSESV